MKRQALRGFRFRPYVLNREDRGVPPSGRRSSCWQGLRIRLERSLPPRPLPVILWDVNLWVHAFRSDSPSHELARAELDATFVTADRRFERFQGLTCRYLQA